MTSDRHYTASAFVIGADNRILLIHHVKSGLWLPPGGHIESGEIPAEAALREAREETGLEAQVVAKPIFEHPAVISHPLPFTIIEATAADLVNGPHQHIDFLYLYGLFRLSIHPLQGRRSGSRTCGRRTWLPMRSPPW